MSDANNTTGDTGGPLVSVIIPTYRHAEFILQTLDSVFAQSWKNFEVIVVNDGSPDHTAQLLRAPVERGLIRCIEQSNAGQAASRNRGLVEARGELIAFLDDDDLWPEDHLQWQVEQMVGDPGIVLVYGYSESFGGSDPPVRMPASDAPSGNVFARLAESAWMRSPGQALIRRWALDQIGGFDSTLWGTDDWDLYLRLARCGRFQFSDRLALHYRTHAANASLRFDRMYRNGCRMARKNFPGNTEPDKSLRLTAIRCARDFTTGQGIRLAARQKSAGQRMSILGTIRKLLWIRPGLLADRQIFIHLMWAVTPARILDILRIRRPL